MALAAREGVTLDRRAGRGRGFGPDAVLRERHGVVARRGGLVAVLRAVFAVVGHKLARRSHRQQRPHVGASHAAQRPVGESREEPVVELVGRRPPARILVIEVRVGAHDVERHDGHHAVGQNCPGIRRSEVGGSDEGVDPGSGFLRPHRSAEKSCGERHSRKRSSQTHHRMLFFFVNSMISGMYPKANPVTVSAHP